VPETGIIDTPTMIAIYQRGIESGTPTTTTEPPVTAPPSTEAPAPAPTEPPATAPPATQPPVTEPPVTAPPVTEPPVTEPPVIEPPVTEPPTTEPPLPPAEDQLFDVLSADPELSILVDVLRALGFNEDFQQLNVYTMFAPTNDAFLAVYTEAELAGFIEQIPEDPELSARLTGVLAYHLVDGALTSAALTPGPLVTVYGAPVTIAIAGDGTVTVNDATVVAADILASNGVVHKIDTILQPPPGQPR
jgi:uncharacterized surface protein with fasciclin (FAS1) repeats